MEKEEMNKSLFLSAIADIECGIAKALFYSENISPVESRKRYNKIIELGKELIETLGFS